MTVEAPTLYFFLSFATSNPRDDELVERLFIDLGHEIRAVAGLRPGSAGTVGFLSSATLRLGSDWWATLRAALDHAATFVALCAPTYFASPACGKEWHAFAARIAAAGAPAPCLLPLPWLREPMPDVVAHLQYADRALSPALHQTGLRDLILFDRYRDDYAAFIGAFARHIVDLAHHHPLPPGHTAGHYDRQPQAFPEQTRPLPTPRKEHARTEERAEPPDLTDRFPRLQGP